MADERGWASALRNAVTLCDEVGRPIVFRSVGEPPEHTRKLMATLGVKVEVVKSSLESKVDREWKERRPTTSRCICGWSFEAPLAEARAAYSAHVETCAAAQQAVADARAARAPKKKQAPKRDAFRPAQEVRAAPPVEMPSLEEPVVRRFTREMMLAAFRRFFDERGRWPLPFDSAGCAYLPGKTAVANNGGWASLWAELGAGKMPVGRAASNYRGTGSAAVLSVGLERAAVQEPPEEPPVRETAAAEPAERTFQTVAALIVDGCERVQQLERELGAARAALAELVRELKQHPEYELVAQLARG